MQKAFDYINSQLKKDYSSEEIRSFFYLIAQKLTGYSFTEIIVNKNTTFSEEQTNTVKFFVEQLNNSVPIQYIIGTAEFFGLPFKVNHSVLIPRPETEELIEWIIAENKEKKSLRILDIGTGSGCIAIALKHALPLAEVYAMDVDKNALIVAQQNAQQNNTDVHFIFDDILKPGAIAALQWDIIVSNPPYIPINEKKTLDKNVLTEPHLALFVPDEDPLLFYRNIILYGEENLTRGGKLYFEIHQKYGKECFELFSSKYFSDMQLKKDISGNDRMLRARKA